ncbi:MAG: NUDIX domain-containing protein [Treponema sp.]|nr:NUDIX domain-containing protein [Treponema sp.]
MSYPKSRHWVCADCGFDLYNNVAAAVGLIIADRKEKVLFEKRAKEPRRGLCAFPGGFVDPGEGSEDAALRECREETGLRPVSLSYLCSYPNVYEYKSMLYFTCDMFFLAELPTDINLLKVLKADPEEVEEFVFYPVESREDILKIPLAFPSAAKALEVYLKLKEYRNKL